MNLHILTDAEERLLINKYHEYTSQDVAELSTLSSGIESLVTIMTDRLVLNCRKVDDDYDNSLSVFSIL